MPSEQPFFFLRAGGSDLSDMSDRSDPSDQSDRALSGGLWAGK